jgi:hypothetical protein
MTGGWRVEPLPTTAERSFFTRSFFMKKKIIGGF